MLFSSIVFLCFFLPAVVVIHALLPQRLRNGFLLLASLIFYAWGDARYLPLFLLLAVLNYACGLAMGHWPKACGWVCALGVLANAGALIYYKYAGLLLPFLKETPALPLGISFYVFQSLSYLLDVRARRVQPERNLLGYATYIMLFPQLIAGPIVRYSDVADALKKRLLTPQRLEKGMMLFLIGLGSKVLLANPLGALFESLCDVADRGMLGTIFAVLAYGFQIYYDFAGYSLMAMGIGEMLGFTFPRNFCHPYAAKSIRDFWHRWHITLGDWLRTYIYIPLGGSRRGSVRTILNLLITWGLSGLWHGAGLNFLAWGLYFGVLLILERFVYGNWLSRHPAAGHVYAFMAVMASWIFFAFTSVPEMAVFTSQLFQPALGENVLFLLSCSAVPLLLGVIFAVPRVCRACGALLEKHPVIRCAALLIVLVLCVMELLGSQYNPFLYFRF